MSLIAIKQINIEYAPSIFPIRKMKTTAPLNGIGGEQVEEASEMKWNTFQKWIFTFSRINIVIGKKRGRDREASSLTQMNDIEWN